MSSNTVIHWFRRDLRLHDNIALNEALKSGKKVLCLFIFDSDIISELPRDDARVNFIFQSLTAIDRDLRSKGSGILVEMGKPLEVFKKLSEELAIDSVYLNRDYEPYARERDNTVYSFLKEKEIEIRHFKDQVIFEKDEVTKDDGLPYTVYTPYMKKWRSKFRQTDFEPQFLFDGEFYAEVKLMPTLSEIGFEKSSIELPDINLSAIPNYAETRNTPSVNGTSHFGPHLRFGTQSVRQLMKDHWSSETFINELIWREFFMQILYHFPSVISENFHSKYDGIKWRNDERDFEKWCEGKTGYPIVDAGMRELNQTGYMHNRVRMITASFLCKHLLIDWRWGEAYFALKLLDFDLSSNNGNWQWAAGTGCDASPYFRVFNPWTQQEKFDPELIYVRKWIPEFETDAYPNPMVDHKMARERAISTYKEGIEK